MTVQADNEAFVRLAFAAQLPLAWLGAELDSVEDGAVTIVFTVRDDLCTAGSGIVMGGVTALVADVAAGLSLLTRLSPPRPILTSSMTAHQLSPAKGDRIICTGIVLKIGKTAGIARADVFAQTGADRRHAATLTASFAIP